MTRLVLLLTFLLLFTHAQPLLAVDTDYQVGEGDVLKVNVYDHLDLTTIVRVSSDGAIIFPLIGQVEIGGLTVSQVAQKVGMELADGYIVNPQVSVFVEEFRSKKVVIMGHVNNPGLYELSGATTLLELISKAGGLNEDAGDELTIRHKGAPVEEVTRVNLKDLLERGDTSKDVFILDGDNVFIAKAGMFYVTGEVKKPDAYKLEEGTTVIKAISMAGGFTQIASKGRIKVIRVIDGQERIMERTPMDEQILPDDVIVVPESFF
ncbi:MAG: periplasmic polysaccharide biosynthesis/export protein [Desulfuromonas sp.]|uniref:SLBB domain-containing protein n=1 Tax=Desulfuromonas sp. TaxID=892 RepID=UPI000CBAD45A|nr:SLBB domain-containing protein [Desulfuromonas sp.]PLX84641.1 MAG: periplasmic polysaccharide biosynthesis/export protein [Desulfuromonas sp.]